eukprot:2191675-Pyramimonas_sp.AAC.1
MAPRGPQLPQYWLQGDTRSDCSKWPRSFLRNPQEANNIRKQITDTFVSASRGLTFRLALGL